MPYPITFALFKVTSSPEPTGQPLFDTLYQQLRSCHEQTVARHAEELRAYDLTVTNLRSELGQAKADHASIEKAFDGYSSVHTAVCNAAAVLRTEVTRLRGVLASLQTTNTEDSSTVEKQNKDQEDAAAYRFLVAEHSRVDPLCQLSCKQGNKRVGYRWVNSINFDLDVKAAMKEHA